MQRLAVLSIIAACGATALAGPAMAIAVETSERSRRPALATAKPQLPLPRLDAVSVLTPRRPQPGAWTLLRMSRAAVRPLTHDDICRTLAAAARDHNLPPLFFARLIWFESRFDPWAISRVGAQGVAQIMPSVAAEIGLADPFDPRQALPASARLLSELRQRFGNWGLAAAAYNAGSRRVREWMNQRGGMPLETRRYVVSITGLAPERWADLSPKNVEFRRPARLPCTNLPKAETHAFAGVPMPPVRPGTLGRDAPVAVAAAGGPPGPIRSAAAAIGGSTFSGSTPRAASPTRPARTSPAEPVRTAALAPAARATEARPKARRPSRPPTVTAAIPAPRADPGAPLEAMRLAARQIARADAAPSPQGTAAATSPQWMLSASGPVSSSPTVPAGVTAPQVLAALTVPTARHTAGRALAQWTAAPGGVSVGPLATGETNATAMRSVPTRPLLPLGQTPTLPVLAALPRQRGEWPPVRRQDDTLLTEPPVPPAVLAAIGERPGTVAALAPSIAAAASAMAMPALGAVLHRPAAPSLVVIARDVAEFEPDIATTLAAVASAAGTAPAEPPAPRLVTALAEPRADAMAAPAPAGRPTPSALAPERALAPPPAPVIARDAAGVDPVSTGSIPRAPAVAGLPAGEPPPPRIVAALAGPPEPAPKAASASGGASPAAIPPAPAAIAGLPAGDLRRTGQRPDAIAATAGDAAGIRPSASPDITAARPAAPAAVAQEPPTAPAIPAPRPGAPTVIAAAGPAAVPVTAPPAVAGPAQGAGRVAVPMPPTVIALREAPLPPAAAASAATARARAHGETPSPARPLPTGVGELPAKEIWTVQLAAHWSREQALAGYERLRRDHPAILDGLEAVAVTGNRLGGRGAARTQVQIALATREQAEDLCERLRAAGGACVVLRNS